MNEHRTQEYKMIGLNIAYYRKLKGFTQLQLAELVNISRTHMSRIETADCAVSLDLLLHICSALEIEPKTLFDFK